MRFGTWNVRCLCRRGLWRAVTKELGRYKLDLVYRGPCGGRVAQNGQGVVHWSAERKTYNRIEHVLKPRRRYLSTLDVRSFRGADCHTCSSKSEGETGSE
jgi:hypothetical protein